MEFFLLQQEYLTFEKSTKKREQYTVKIPNKKIEIKFKDKMKLPYQPTTTTKFYLKKCANVIDKICRVVVNQGASTID